MADNVAFTPGTGATGATDDIGGVHYPRVKATWGPDGTANDTDVATGKPMPVQVRSATGLVPIGEPTDDKSTATDTTSVSMISLLKQVSASIQALAALIDTGALFVKMPPGEINENGRVSEEFSAPIAVDTETFALITTIAGLSRAEDAAHSDGHTGIPALAVRRDAKAVGSGTDGDYSTLNVSAHGDLRVDGGKAHIVRVAPTVTAGAYTANDTLGGEMTITDAARISGGSGILTGITMAVEDDGANLWVADDVEVLIFDSNPGGTYTDNATLDSSSLTDADAFLLVGSVLLDTASALGNVVLLKATNVNLPYVCNGSANLFAVALNRGGRTPDATDAIQFTFHMIRD